MAGVLPVATVSKSIPVLVCNTNLRYQSARGRGYIQMSMRHWLAWVLARERSALFRALPESFKVGLELPTGAHGVSRPTFGSRGRSPHQPIRRFIHGCELVRVC